MAQTGRRAQRGAGGVVVQHQGNIRLWSQQLKTFQAAVGELGDGEPFGFLRQLCLAERHHLAKDRAAAIDLVFQQQQIFRQQAVGGIVATQLR